MMSALVVVPRDPHHRDGEKMGKIDRFWGKLSAFSDPNHNNLSTLGVFFGQMSPNLGFLTTFYYFLYFEKNPKDLDQRSKKFSTLFSSCFYCFI